jgi:predicted Zn-dependent protease with MMP-like domain
VNPREHIESLLDRAEDALDKGNAEGAIELCGQVLEVIPDHAGANFVRGDALRVLGALEQAGDAYRAAALKRPDHAASWASLALTAFELLDFDESRRSVSRAVHEDARNPEAWWVRSLLQEWRGDLAGAQRSLAHAQWLDPTGFPMPPHLSDSEVERLVEQAILKLHPDLQELLSNVAVILDEVPSMEVLMHYDPPASPLELLGYFSGQSVMERSTDDPWSSFPATIVLFRRNLARISSDRDELVDQLRITIFHEIGHFLGLDELDVAKRGLE